MKEVSIFQKKVYDITALVPKGKVTTYGEIARKLESSPRAVGGALKRNPFAPIVPCHRVVATTRHLHGFKGHCGDNSPTIGLKRKMLEDEGVLFESENLVDRNCIFYF